MIFPDEAPALNTMKMGERAIIANLDRTWVLMEGGSENRVKLKQCTIISKSQSIHITKLERIFYIYE